MPVLNLEGNIDNTKGQFQLTYKRNLNYHARVKFVVSIALVALFLFLACLLFCVLGKGVTRMKPLKDRVHNLIFLNPRARENRDQYRQIEIGRASCRERV